MYLGLDLGTTNVKAVVVDEAGRIVGHRFRAGRSLLHARRRRRTGHRADLGRPPARPSARRPAAVGGAAIRAVGVSSQGGAMQLLDGQERPVGRVISWLDGRGRPFDRGVDRRAGRQISSPSTSATAAAP